jgi:hypothetical protein
MLEASGTEVRAIRDIDGPGVEFDLYFPADRDPATALYRVSSFDCGDHRLVASDVEAFDNYALDMRVVKVNGEAPKASMPLNAGVYFNGGRSFQSLRAGLPAGPAVDTVVSRMGLKRMAVGLDHTASQVDDIGFRVTLDRTPADRDVTVTLRVEPTPGATPLRVPEKGPPSFTLSDEALMRLEALGDVMPIVARRDVDGPGVEFDFQFKMDATPAGRYLLPPKVLTRILPEANKIGGSFALEFSLVNAVPKLKNDREGWGAQAWAKGRNRPTFITPARSMRTGVGRTILRGPFDELGMALWMSTKPDTDRVVTILIKPAPGATVLR